MILSELINKYGDPKLLIDHWDADYLGLACYDFEETLEWNEKGLFLNNNQVNNPSLDTIHDILESWKNDRDISAVGYISYNFKNKIYPHINFKNKKNNQPYLFFAKPSKLIEYNIVEEDIQTSEILKLQTDLMDINQYSKIIDEIKQELYKGNTYQINFTMPKEYLSLDTPINIFLQLRQKAKPKFGYYLKHNDIDILSFSPEQFFKRTENMIYSYPMKGTRPRSNIKSKDELLKTELQKSRKDKAEHLMIVDLLRNDIGKISKYGSVKVNNLYGIQSYETVHQMVSEVSGELIDDIHEMNIIEALFPGGSVTGAPKESAMKIIDRLEDYNRNIYTGAIGYIKNNGDMNFNIPIRTMTIYNNIVTYPVGGGIVWDSTSKEEWNEAQLKSKILSYESSKQKIEYE